MVTVWTRSRVCHSDQVEVGERAPRRVIVIGGGISGLCAAWFLRERPDPPQVTVLEAAAEVGGKLRAGDLGGHAVDAGAESMLARRPEAVDLARAVGLAAALEEPTTSAARVMVDGVLRDFPTGTVLGVPGDLRALAASRVLTWRGLARAQAERAVPVSPSDTDVAVGRYVTARLGHEVTDRLVEPLLGGVYAGHADQLSLQASMPAIAASRAQGERLTTAAARIRATAGGTADGTAPFVGLSGGLFTLVQRLAAAPGVDVRTRTIAREVTRRPDGSWQVVVGPVPAPERLVADAVVLAVPAGPAARLARSVSPAAAALLDVVDDASVGRVALGYRRADVPASALKGSGHLVPPREGRAIKAVTYSSNKWRWVSAALPDLVVVRMSVGRFGEADDLRRDDPDLVRLASEDAADVLALSARPVVGSVFRWGGALPQYTVGHVGRATRVHRMLAETPGLVIAGAALDGVGVPACIASARRAVDQVLQDVDRDATMSG
jgi:oxygen-dependent protoporphyrinogen oxidase